MKLPSFQFYPGDWLKDPNLRRCSHAAKGVWVDILCLMFESEERGVLVSSQQPWSDSEIAHAVGGDNAVVLACVQELTLKGVANRRGDGALYSKRLVRDEHKRKLCVEAGKRGGSPLLKQTLKGDAKGERKGEFNGHSNRNPTPSSSSSTSSSKGEERALTPEDSLIENYKAKLENSGIAVPTDPPKRSKFPPGIPEKMQTAAMLEALRIWQEHLIDLNVTPSRPQWHSTGLKLESVGERRGFQVIDFSLGKGAKNLIWDAPENHALTVLKHIGASVAQKQEGEPPGWREWARSMYPGATITTWQALAGEIKREFAAATPQLKWRGIRWFAE